MLKIKLTRRGKRDQALYRIVIQEARSRSEGKYVDILGTYNPHTNPATIELDQNKYQDWIGKGALPTPTVKSIFERSSKKSETPAKPKTTKKPKAEKAAAK